MRDISYISFKRYGFAALTLLLLFCIFQITRVDSTLLSSLTVLTVIRDSQKYIPIYEEAEVDEETRFREAVATIRPSDASNHSRTLGIADGIFVISLERRQDRRDLMDAIARALDLNFNYISATDFKTPKGLSTVEKLIERVRWQRDRIDDREAKQEDWPKQSASDREDDGTYIWNAFPFAWSEDVVENAKNPLDKPIGWTGADFWDMDPPDEEWEAAHPLPSLTDEEKRVGVPMAVVKNILHKRQNLTNAAVSCWHSHVKALREIVRRQLNVAIVFEDDIDIEWDVERLLKLQLPFLPDDWDIVYLGHCFSQEYDSPLVPGSALLRPTKHTLCTHGYAVSLRGATRLLRYLRSPDYAFSRPIDHAIKDLYQMHDIKSYSIYPPVVVQTKSDVSDITGTVETHWKVKEALVDSTVERLAMLKSIADVDETVF